MKKIRKRKIKSTGKILKWLDHDLIHCPISLAIIRHPVLASNGRHYELSSLVRFLKASPNNRESGQVITSAVYDNHLKATLDKGFANHPDREEDYDKKILLEELHRLLPNPSRDLRASRVDGVNDVLHPNPNGGVVDNLLHAIPRSDPAIKATLTGLGMYVWATLMMLLEQRPQSYSMLFTVIATCSAAVHADYKLRLDNNDAYGIFYLGARMFQQRVEGFEMQLGLQPEPRQQRRPHHI